MIRSNVSEEALETCGQSQLTSDCQKSQQYGVVFGCILPAIGDGLLTLHIIANYIYIVGRL